MNYNVFIRLAVDLLIPVLLLVGAYITGRIIDRRRREYLDRREQELNDIVLSSTKGIPTEWEIKESSLVTGSVVVANNYFKSFLAGFRNIFGGEMKSYQILLEQARRIATVRMLEEARAVNAAAVINVRLETSSIQGNNTKKNAAGIEIIAYGTALVKR